MLVTAFLLAALAAFSAVVVAVASSSRNLRGRSRVSVLLVASGLLVLWGALAFSVAGLP